MLQVMEKYSYVRSLYEKGQITRPAKATPAHDLTNEGKVFECFISNQHVSEKEGPSKR
jgi:hypothetical protein